MYSIRRRLILVLAVGFVVLIAGAGVYAEDLLRGQVTGEFDSASLVKARSLVALTEQDGGQIEIDWEPEDLPEYNRAERPEYFQIWLDDGTPLLRSPRLDGDLPRTPGLSTAPAIRDVRLPDGRSGRVLQLAFVPRGPGEDDEDDAALDPAALEPDTGMRALVLVVARDRERLDALLGRMRLTFFGVGAAVMLLAAVLVWRALVSGFRPIEAIASQVGELDAESLGSRIALPRTPRELAPIVHQLNALLNRLEASFERERRFTGNVAHELRTPIAELRSLAEVGERWPEDTESISGFFEDVHGIAGRMEQLVVDLLLLARCQAGVETAERRPTNLREIVESTWSNSVGRAAAKRPRFHLEMGDDLVVESDPDKLGIILGNLFDNAVSHSPPGSEIRCVGSTGGASFLLNITNPSEPLSPEDLENLSEPFWRKDVARSSGEHAGLGLSLVSALAGLLGLEVEFAQEPDGTFRARLGGGLAGAAGGGGPD